RAAEQQAALSRKRTHEALTLYRLGQEFESKRDMVSALNSYEGSLALGNMAAVLKVGTYLLRGYNVAQIDEAKSYSFFKQAYDAKTPGSAFWLGQCIQRGFGCAVDQAHARRIYISDI